MLTGALIGFGTEASEIYVPALLDGTSPLEIGAVAAGGPGELQAAALKFPGARKYRSAEELFSKETKLDFAAITLPPAQRAACMLRALESRLHVFCHPPFCFSTGEFDKLKETADRSGRTLFSAHPWENSSPYAALSKAVSRELPGEILRAEVRMLTPRRAGRGPAAGVTAALGWQAFSILLGIVRRPPLAITARLGLKLPYDAEEEEATAAFQVHFGEATGSVYLAAGAHASRFQAAVIGKKGLLELGGAGLRLDVAGQAEETVALKENLAEGLARPHWLLQELKAFRDEIENPALRGAGLKNSRHCIKLLKNAYYSAGVNSAAVPL
ncbi:MAG TPA: Gfo/Idh/MocA family oxidoreductase [Elusimicrobiales bacterium]|nr:Gfo/Idh/MocA family oxidoreductase [Elusimicrobiales bacterium]